jgi:hypothetical protein
MGCFSDLFSGKLSPFCEKEKEKKEYIVTNSFLKKKPISQKKIKNLPEITTTNYTVVEVV